MLNISIHTDPAECRRLWEAHIPQKVVFDLWDVRNAFHRTFARELCFVSAERDGASVGFLPLCKIPETGTLGFFPGEAWHGKTWLEQNRLFADSRATLDAMIAFAADCTGLKYHIRYLLPSCELQTEIEDETGYLFTPSRYGYSMDGYYASFTGRTAKKMKKESSVYEKFITVMYDRQEDFELLIKMNTDRFGSDSYFSDKKFADGFRNLISYLNENKMLRITTVLVDGEYAAIDAGSIFNNVYTLLAGGTNIKFPGIAKFINTLHMGYSCRMGFDHADFLCGNFSWKSMFHLEPRPLYKISNTEESVFEVCHA
ncbi:GNAT family N-acetyltransferase [Seleniivibrio sp.]|uniref:GNAT family N-acetyltransferase n=1 Tax=Seleniivibrio sp. TaxID=2898801 RepID=UPI0025F4838D|nr:GNAT family N-acetyltransferase [Seleniivibrio sp.]MCD8552849.1 GNAT family N-acetyltransferase [Seleniivibrio sp.]